LGESVRRCGRGGGGGRDGVASCNRGELEYFPRKLFPISLFRGKILADELDTKGGKERGGRIFLLMKGVTETGLLCWRKETLLSSPLQRERKRGKGRGRKKKSQVSFDDVKQGVLMRVGSVSAVGKRRAQILNRQSGEGKGKKMKRKAYGVRIKWI